MKKFNLLLLIFGFSFTLFQAQTSKKSINEYVPLYLAEKGVSTQFTMTTIEELGLLKMDFLGLRNLTVIRDTMDLVWENHKKKIDFSHVTYDDPKVYEVISSGNTMGVFQMESGGMTQFMKNLKPDCFEDIVAGISLYRPGPMNSIPKYIENKKNILYGPQPGTDSFCYLRVHGISRAGHADCTGLGRIYLRQKRLSAPCNE